MPFASTVEMKASSRRHSSLSACFGVSSTVENGSPLRAMTCRRSPTRPGTSRYAATPRRVTTVGAAAAAFL